MWYHFLPRLPRTATYYLRTYLPACLLPTAYCLLTNARTAHRHGYLPTYLPTAYPKAELIARLAAAGGDTISDGGDTISEVGDTISEGDLSQAKEDPVLASKLRSAPDPTQNPDPNPNPNPNPKPNPDLGHSHAEPQP